MDGGDPRFLLGTDNQGRDLFSAILYGLRVSIAIGGGAVLVAAAIGVAARPDRRLSSAAGRQRRSCASATSS